MSVFEPFFDSESRGPRSRPWTARDAGIVASTALGLVIATLLAYGLWTGIGQSNLGYTVTRVESGNVTWTFNWDSVVFSNQTYTVDYWKSNSGAQSFYKFNFPAPDTIQAIPATPAMYSFTINQNTTMQGTYFYAASQNYYPSLVTENAIFDLDPPPATNAVSRLSGYFDGPPYFYFQTFTAQAYNLTVGGTYHLVILAT